MVRNMTTSLERKSPVLMVTRSVGSGLAEWLRRPLMRLSCRFCSLSLIVTTIGCAATPEYIVTDVQSRREYSVTGQPTFLNGGGISFIDQYSGHMVTLQSYEVQGAAGEQYRVGKNAWTGRDEIQRVKRHGATDY